MTLTTRSFDILNVRITYKKARVPLLEAVAFKDKGRAYKEMMALDGICECVILQTCNRVELYAVSACGKTAAKSLKEYLANRAGAMMEEAIKAIEISMNHDALKHILEVASGLDSMVIGENEILGQVWDAYLQAESHGAAGPILGAVFRKAVSVGKRVRSETEISRGAASFGSVSVKLAEELMGGLCGKNVLVIGAGEMGTCVAKALARSKPNTIFIANRTYERAVKLAEDISGKALRFDKLEEALVEADVVICATGAPHYILTKDTVCRILENRRGNRLLIIDISNPRNVEESIAELDGVMLYDIDDFQAIVERSLTERQKSAEKAAEIIEEELPQLYKELREQCIRDLISQIVSRSEEMRREELSKAFNMLNELDERERRIIDDLTRIILKRVLMPMVENLKAAASNGDRQLIEETAKLFGMEELSLLEWSGANE
ncbi:MAG: glutamyl-tRNA reductase [Candidatus Bathyarchaeia archaeon]